MMMRRKLVVAVVSAVVYACSMVVAFGATGGIAGVSSFASALVPDATAHADPYGPYGQYGKTTICHKGVTITVADAALPAHMAHGDTIGPCAAPPQEGKTTLCHNGVTITVSDDAVPAHMQHGDQLGPCKNAQLRRR